jgi:hypothetical protein
MCGRSVKAIRSPHWTRQGTSGFARGLRQLPSPAAGAEVAKAALGVGERERIGDEAGFEGGGADDGAERRTKGDRDAIFNGFNTPLLPDILICTQVGQEGIDLHRHCRQVIHYDLGWNPASIEQRTGRVDRIGSKAARERKIFHKFRGGSNLSEDDLPGLDISLPYLAGTYDERMFDRLRARAQVFDILTGGDPTADQDAETHWLDPDSEGEDDAGRFVPLPRQMLDDLRVSLAVEGSLITWQVVRHPRLRQR